MPVLPATSTPGTAPAIPVPLRTTSSMRSVTVPAISSLVTSTGSASGARPGSVTSGVGLRMPPAAIVCATDAISSGVARTSPCPIADSPTATSSSRSGGIELSAGLIASSPAGLISGGRAVEAEALGGLDELLAADLDAERREDRVARLGEALHEGAAAGESWALEISRPIVVFDVSTGNVSSSETASSSSAAVVVMILKVEPGRLRGRVGDAGERPHRPVVGVEHGDAAEEVAERGRRRLLERGVDRRVDRLARDRLALREHAPVAVLAGDREQLAARLAGEPDC